MTAETTYLEFSEEGGSSHKFYKVTVDGVETRIRFGRIGEAGQIQTKTHATHEKARAEAQKKIKDKLKKGYQPSVMGVRQW